MRHRIDAGRETFAVFVADAPDGRGDLYAMTGVGSDVVAFLRSRDVRDTLRTRVWLLNLLNGAERELALPDSSGVPEDLAWADDGRALVVRTSAGAWSLSTPPAPPNAVVLSSVPASSVRVGYPSFASVAPCADLATNLCVYPDSGTPAVLDDGARDAFRWGDDSVAYVRGRDVVIRPLGPGRSRTLRWREGLRNPREPEAFVKTGPTVRDSP
jgi:hypothetical protein